MREWFRRREERRAALIRAKVRDGHERGRKRLLAVHLRRMGLYIVFCLLVGLGGFEGPLSTAGWLLAILLLVNWIPSKTREADAYRDGWLEGRMDAISHIPQSESFQEWFNTLAIHDQVHVLGALVAVPDTPEGLDES